MEIRIIYCSKEYKINVHKFESIYSILHRFLHSCYRKNNEGRNIIEYFDENYIIDYKSIHLQHNFCLDKYNIPPNSILNIRRLNKFYNSIFFYKFLFVFLLVFGGIFLIDVFDVILDYPFFEKGIGPSFLNLTSYKKQIKLYSKLICFLSLYTLLYYINREILYYG